MTYFAFLLGMGAILSQLRLARVAPWNERNTWLTAGLGILLSALTGARLAYCLERFSYYSHRLLEVLAFWLGGLAWQGAVIGALLALIFLYFAWQKPFSTLLDLTSVMLLPMAVTGWLGAWTEGTAYGAVLPSGTWWGLPSMNVNGEAALHAPLQLAASISLLGLLAAVELLSPKRRHPGARGALIWFIFSLMMIPLTLLRADPAPLLLNLRVETGFAILFAAISLGLFLAILLSPKVKISNPSPASLDELMKDGLS